jgi:hypothetical protein
MRLDLENPKVWDRWRELYSDLTREENIEFGNAIEAKFPFQASYNFEIFKPLFRGVHRSRVLEIGGWKGELALQCFQNFEIDNWFNVDMCKAAIEKTLPALHRLPYLGFFPLEFDWFRDKREDDYDVCVSAHAIEHLSDDHLKLLIKYISGIKTVQFESPICMDGQTWEGYVGTHILKMGWTAINDLMRAEGYKVLKINDWSFRYDLEGVNR